MFYKPYIANLVLCLFMLVKAGTVFSTVYYVATTGSDSNPGTLTEPLASLQKAQEKVVAGDTVYIRGGTYEITEAFSPASLLSIKAGLQGPGSTTGPTRGKPRFLTSLPSSRQTNG